MASDRRSVEAQIVRKGKAVDLWAALAQRGSAACHELAAAVFI